MLMGGFIKPSVIGEFLKAQRSLVNFADETLSIADRWRAYLRSQGAVGLQTHELEFQWLRLQGFTGTFVDMFYQKYGDRDTARDYFNSGALFTNFAKTTFLSQTMTDNKLRNLILYGLSTQASVPTPDVPVPIVSTTGNVTVRSASPSKNLFDAGVGITIGFYYDGGGTAIASASDFIQTAYIPVLPNTTYTMSHAGNAIPKIVQYSSNKTFNSRTFAISANSVTVTTASNTAFVRLSTAITQLATTQFELGAVATAFVPHNVSTQTLPLATTQLRSLPNGVSDRIYKDGSTWKLEQNVEQKVFTGAAGEPWFAEGSTASTTRFAYYPTLGMGKDSALNSQLPYISGYNVDSEHMFIAPNGAAVYFFMATTRVAANVTAFRAYLATNNMTVVIALPAPVTTTITDPTLITALENIRTYQGITNITASTPISGQYPRP